MKAPREGGGLTTFTLLVRSPKVSTWCWWSDGCSIIRCRLCRPGSYPGVLFASPLSAKAGCVGQGENKQLSLSGRVRAFTARVDDESQATLARRERGSVLGPSVSVPEILGQVWKEQRHALIPKPSHSLPPPIFSHPLPASFLPTST